MFSLSNLRAVVAATLLAGSLAAASTAEATTMYYLDVEQLVELSDVVVTGRVVAARTFIGDHDRISTAWSIEIEQVHEGQNVAGVIEIEQWGGELNGEVLYIPGDARFVRGERVMVFLREVDGRYFLSAMGQSKFTVGELPTPTIRLDLEPGVLAPAETERAPLGVVATPVAELASPAPDVTTWRDLTDLTFYNRTDNPTVFGGGLESFSYSQLVQRVELAASLEVAP